MSIDSPYDEWMDLKLKMFELRKLFDEEMQNPDLTARNKAVITYMYNDYTYTFFVSLMDLGTLIKNESSLHQSEPFHSKFLKVFDTADADETSNSIFFAIKNKLQNNEIWWVNGSINLPTQRICELVFWINGIPSFHRNAQFQVQQSFHLHMTKWKNTKHQTNKKSKILFHILANYKNIIVNLHVKLENTYEKYM